MPHRLLLAFFFWLIYWPAHSQNVPADTSQLRFWGQRWQAEYIQQRSYADSLAQARGLLTFYADSTTAFELQAFDSLGQPRYFQTNNQEAALTHRVTALLPGGTSGLALDGSGQAVGIWDSGPIRHTHTEFGPRVTFGDGSSQQAAAGSFSNHATHVAGTVGAAGVWASARGMAPQVDLRSFDWNNDLSEMSTAAANGLLISNHSYGFRMGWSFNQGLNAWEWWGNTSINTTQDYLFGFYTSRARSWDQLAGLAPYYLIVQSAGNDRQEGPAPGTLHYVWTGIQWDTSTAVRPTDGPYDCLSAAAVAKNVLTVGAVHKQPNYTGPGSVQMSFFSSWGPTDDGRIKPDLVAAGVSLLSAASTSNTSYQFLSGTSMSAPGVAGALALLQQRYQQLRPGLPLRAASLKGLVLHTADEAGDHPGPDYRFGWGLLNATRAADFLVGLDGDHHLREAHLTSGQVFEQPLFTDGTEPLRITLSWTDLPGTPPSAALNPTQRMLVHDLDVRLVGENGTAHQPYVLDPAQPAAAATTGDNFRDNIEQVYLAAVPPGRYTVRVTHKGTLASQGQAFSLLISGAYVGANFCAATPKLQGELLFGEGWQSLAVSDTSATPYWHFQAEAGRRYAWAACGAPAGTQLRLYRDSLLAKTVAVGDNCPDFDDPNGWICPQTGTYYLLATGPDCAPLAANWTLYRFLCGQTQGNSPLHPDTIPTLVGQDFENFFFVTDQTDTPCRTHTVGNPSPDVVYALTLTGSALQWLNYEINIRPDFPAVLRLLDAQGVEVASQPATPDEWGMLSAQLRYSFGPLLTDADTLRYLLVVEGASEDDAGTFGLDVQPCQTPADYVADSPLVPVTELPFVFGAPLTDCYSDGLQTGTPDAFFTIRPGDRHLLFRLEADFPAVLRFFTVDATRRPAQEWLTLTTAPDENGYALTHEIVQFPDSLTTYAEGGAAQFYLVVEGESAPGTGFFTFTVDNPPIGLPVRLLGFGGQPRGDAAHLYWQTASEQHNAGFEVQRGRSPDAFVPIGFVEGQGTTHQPQHYAFADADWGGAAYYRLRQLDYDGTATYGPTIFLQTTRVPDFRVYPNPGREWLTATGWPAAPATLTLHNALGQAVRTWHPAGADAQLFLGDLPRGLYTLTLQTPLAAHVRKLVLE